LIAELAGTHRLPVIFPYRDYFDLGGLISYAPELSELAQRLAGPSGRGNRIGVSLLPPRCFTCPTRKCAKI
jgi:hypothetical protein